ncbi:MAG: sigma-54-dependent Fis family transcriptional regulator [Labilithrix sp.]|nr:sigma-54-dependent Fis family transcriptional regulator [Labilithrix sp.]
MPSELDDERLESTQTVPARPTVRREPAIVPTVTVGDGAGARAVVVDEPIVVGASKDVALVLQDPKVSRLHAELSPRADGLWVSDLGSKNGTWLEGIRVASALVPNGATVRLGDASLLVRYAQGERERELWPHASFHRLRGGSDPMRALYARLARCAASDATVLVRGETGTGKELVAEALHDASARAGMPFVVVDCGAMPANLLEAELFGVKRGAFTGADRDRAGAVEVADGGTLFLDEIGELPIDLQPKLLRFLETRTFRRLGEAQHRKADVRVVCATHRDLRRAASAGAFREDLYFRVAVLVAHVPPLRERLEDLAPLVAHFADARLAAADLEELTRHARGRPWPGNVRELRNYVERAVALGLSGASTQRSLTDPPTSPAAFDFDVPVDRPLAEVRQLAGEHVEREYVRKLLARFDGNVTRAAEHAGIARQHLHRLMKRNSG